MEPTATVIPTVTIEPFEIDYSNSTSVISEFPLMGLLIFSVVFLVFRMIKERFIDVE
jgi:hypothetical protein